MRHLAPVVLTILLVSVAISQIKTPQPAPVKRPLSEALQLVLVTTDDWSATKGSARLYRRQTVKSKWQAVVEEFPVVVGRNGLAWAVDSAPERAKEFKKEGDGKAPAGAFPLTFAFGSTSKPEQMTYPYTKLEANTECVDDVASSHYNKIVDRMKVGVFDWKSSEKMLAVGAEYGLGVFVAYNSYPVTAGNGSCIFLHVWKDSETPTSGCTAMDRRILERIVSRLDETKNPYLVQLPKSEYKQLRSAWNLPK